VNIVDIILLVVLSLFALRGYFRGLFRETFSLLGLFLGFMVAVRYDEPVAAFLAESWKASFIVLRGVAFVALFFVTYFSLNLVGWLLHRSASLLFLQGINRIGGVVVGMGKGAALMALAIFFLTSTPLISGKAKENIDHSYLAATFNRLAREIVALSKTRLIGPPESRAGERASWNVFERAA
jgi:membrane protein required for colicin V production